MEYSERYFAVRGVAGFAACHFPSIPLEAAGKVTAEIAQAHAESEFEKYRIVQDRLFESDFDRMILGLPPEADKS